MDLPRSAAGPRVAQWTIIDPQVRQRPTEDSVRLACRTCTAARVIYVNWSLSASTIPGSRDHIRRRRTRQLATHTTTFSCTRSHSSRTPRDKWAERDRVLLGIFLPIRLQANWLYSKSNKFRRLGQFFRATARSESPTRQSTSNSLKYRTFARWSDLRYYQPWLPLHPSLARHAAAVASLARQFSASLS